MAKRGSIVTIIEGPSKEEQASEWAACRLMFGYFADQYCRIDDTQGTQEHVPFKLWPAQRRLAKSLQYERLMIILKARQLGISWLVCAYVLWLCIFNAGKTCLFLSKGQKEANELIRRVGAMYDRLPEWLKRITTTANVKSESIDFGNNSRVISIPATKDAARSYTASFVGMDEFAFLDWAEETYSSVKPVIDGGGQLVLFSTANGQGTVFHKLWSDALNKLNNLKPLFLSWTERPDRDIAFRERMERESADIKQAQQEYPSTPDEAFISTNNERFLPSIGWWDACESDIPPLDPNTPIVVALDAGVESDNFALVGVSRHPQDDGTCMVRVVRKWVPPSNGSLDFGEIEREIVRLAEQYHVISIVYDPYQLHQMAGRLKEEGLYCEQFEQGARRLISDRQLLDLIRDKRVLHDGNTDLRQHLDNADRKLSAEKGQLRIVKRSAHLKIDLAVSLSMATEQCLRLNL